MSIGRLGVEFSVLNLDESPLRCFDLPEIFRRGLNDPYFFGATLVLEKACEATISFLTSD